jgi:aspartyl-tRNA synthetase
VVDFPLFKYNTDEKRWESEHHPFTSPAQEDLGNLEIHPDKVKSRSYDLVLNGTELGSGSIRIHDQKLQQKIFKIIGIEEEDARRRFGFLLEAFQYGAPPHGGFAFGMDRLLTILSGEESIREVIAFPKTSAGACPLTDAPSEVDEKQLKELNLTVIKGRVK